jgi:serine/arginine repetitive matrix protein 2
VFRPLRPASRKQSIRVDEVPQSTLGLPGPVFRRAGVSPPAPLQLELKRSVSSIMSDTQARTPIAREARRGLGTAGTLGGSQGSADTDRLLESDDPDSDIPGELQVILSSGETERFEDTMSFNPKRLLLQSPGSPPDMLLPAPDSPDSLEGVPAFRATLIDADENPADLDGESDLEDADGTSKSFDFTGELRMLNESADRRSFVEQLESAFRTPAKFDLDGFGEFSADDDAPPLPPMPPAVADSFRTLASAEASLLLPSPEISIPRRERNPSELYDLSLPRTAKSSSRTAKSSTRTAKSSTTGLSFPQTASADSIDFSPKDGELNVNFKFGGKSPVEPEFEQVWPVPKALTLSDIIPPPEIQSRLSMASMVEEDSSVLKSIMAKAQDIHPPPPMEPVPSLPQRGAPLSPASSKVFARPRALSDASSKFFERDSYVSYRDSFSGHSPRDSFCAENNPRDLFNGHVNRDSFDGLSYRDSFSGHTRRSSQASFSGLDSFDEIRRGFEFGPDRPAFYPPPGAATHGRGHQIRESVFSIASVSSYGAVLNPGVQDPFDYGRHDLPSRPSSDGFSLSMSMSNSVDDTFDFMQHRDSRRRRVDSDASSFYFRPPAPAPSAMRPLSMRAGHRRNESNMSTMSVAPPVSLYNRSFGVHRRMDSNSSVASHAMGAQRMSWDPRHGRDVSLDSFMSDFSSMHVSRPGLSVDKMLESAQGMPLTAISASPPESLRSERFDRSSAEYDSIMDATRGVFPPSGFEDSIFEKTGHRTSASSESLFGGNDYRPQTRTQLPAARYRPVSIYSIVEDTESFQREDDTMVTVRRFILSPYVPLIFAQMLDGGHIRRRSMDSIVGGSPCVRAGKRKHAAIRGPQDHIAGSDGEIEHVESPNKARLVEESPVRPRLAQKPSIAASIASTSSYVFGGERMARAQHGLLKRDSLEGSCLEADGEDLSCSCKPTSP